MDGIEQSIGGELWMKSEARKSTRETADENYPWECVTQVGVLCVIARTIKFIQHATLFVDESTTIICFTIEVDSRVSVTSVVNIRLRIGKHGD